MNLFDSLTVSGSALSAERQRSEIVAANLANSETTHTDTGGPYRRKEVVFQSSGTSSFRLALASTK
jgi:flagellar basal-body rod protein FlgC